MNRESKFYYTTNIFCRSGWDIFKKFFKKYPLIKISIVFTIFIILVFMACQGPADDKDDNDDNGDDTILTNVWTWVSGSDLMNQSGIYGTKGTASSSNVPGSRFSSISWIDLDDNLWLFGGQGRDSTGNSGYLNDLWRFDGTNWTWVSGSNTRGESGTYGTKGTASPSNTPGARRHSISWVDSSNNLWLFGGDGCDSAGNFGHINDLWKFDGMNWTWVSGSNTRNQVGSYGTKGTASPSNIPGARDNSITWIDSDNNLWLFGGQGYSSSIEGQLNDLWKFDGVNWTWVSGSDTTPQNGIYGIKGTASSSNVPGSRYSGISWIDLDGNFWFFGGYGYDSADTFGHLNDLWKFDGANWTWVSGSDTVDQGGIYGTKGTASSSNVPGSRYISISWIDLDGNFWLFGGDGFDGVGSPSDSLNDLWKFDGANWTWVSGSNIWTQKGVYGTKGTASSSNIPGARERSISWIDSGGNFWLFGGYGLDSTGATSALNDLWKYKK